MILPHPSAMNDNFLSLPFEYSMSKLIYSLEDTLTQSIFQFPVHNPHLLTYKHQRFLIKIHRLVLILQSLQNVTD